MSRLCYQFVVYDIISIQTYVRRFVAKVQSVVRWRAAIDTTCLMRFSAVLIQSCVRGYHARRILCENQGALRIQKCWRCYMSRLCYQFVLYDVISIQAYARRVVAKVKVIRKRMKASRKTTYKPSFRTVFHAASRLIQSSWRSYKSRIDFIYQVASIILVQSVVRSRITRRAFDSYIEGYQRFEMTSPDKHRRSRVEESIETSIQENVTEWLPERRFLKHLLLRNPLWRNEGRIFSWLQDNPSNVPPSHNVSLSEGSVNRALQLDRSLKVL